MCDFDCIFMNESLSLPDEVLENMDEHTVFCDKRGFVGKQWKGCIHDT